MDFGLAGKLDGAYPAAKCHKNAAAGTSRSVSFAELASAKAAEC